jgi:hypothetical protein
MVDQQPAPGDQIRLTRHQVDEWQVQAVWRRVDGDYGEEDWAEIYSPELGRFMIRVGDPAETLHTCPGRQRWTIK